MLQAEADQICRAGRYERLPERVDTRAGSYERKLETKAGVVTLQTPKLRSLPFETAIIERYRRRESSVEEALVENAPGGSERASSLRIPMMPGRRSDSCRATIPTHAGPV